jgi:hypothetical protein
MGREYKNNFKKNGVNRSSFHIKRQTLDTLVLQSPHQAPRAAAEAQDAQVARQAARASPPIRGSQGPASPRIREPVRVQDQVTQAPLLGLLGSARGTKRSRIVGNRGRQAWT